MSLAHLRQQSYFQREIAKAINKVIVDEISGYINVVDTKLSKDLSILKVFYMIFDNKKETAAYTQKLLEQKTPQIRHEFALAVSKNCRKISELRFEIDTVLEYGNKIDEILKNLK